MRPGLLSTRFCTQIATAASLAFDSIRAHKLRSSLTLLGLIIGVGSVVLVGAAIEGFGVFAEETASKVFGSNTYLVAQIASATGRKDFYEKLKRNRPLRPEDLEYLETVSGEKIIYCAYKQHDEDAKRDSQVFENASLMGVSSVLPEVRDVTITEGRFFTAQEERMKQRVCVIGHDVRAALFPNSAAAGRTLRLRGMDFLVVGVEQKLGSSFGRILDNSIYVPFSVYRRLYGTGQNVAIFARARPETGMSLDEALDITKVALRTRFHARPGQPDRFDTLTPDAIRELIDRLLASVSAVLVPVTCISLLVGGIVIMNIMLVSVTERTHEIGVRKSLGARQRDIRLQFLTEAVILSGAGGLLGVLAGVALARAMPELFDVHMRVTLPYIMLALLVSSAVGILSGWYPAHRAARLDPAAALRAE